MLTLISLTSGPYFDGLLNARLCAVYHCPNNDAALCTTHLTTLASTAFTTMNVTLSNVADEQVMLPIVGSNLGKLIPKNEIGVSVASVLDKCAEYSLIDLIIAYRSSGGTVLQH